VTPADEVDQLIAAWNRERPDLDVQPLQVLSRVTRLARHLDIARREAFALHDLEPGEFDVLAALRRAGAPYALTPSQLVNATLVTSGTMTNRIDRLTVKNFVKRTPDPSDGRGVLVELTATGSAKVDLALKDLLVRERELLKNVSRNQYELLASTLRAIVLPLDQHIWAPDEF
jgi:DNA-binding MarR family transcriptional regulator